MEGTRKTCHKRECLTGRDGSMVGPKKENRKQQGKKKKGKKEVGSGRILSAGKELGRISGKKERMVTVRKHRAIRGKRTGKQWSRNVNS